MEFVFICIAVCYSPTDERNVSIYFVAIVTCSKLTAKTTRHESHIIIIIIIIIKNVFRG